MMHAWKGCLDQPSIRWTAHLIVGQKQVGFSNDAEREHDCAIVHTDPNCSRPLTRKHNHLPVPFEALYSGNILHARFVCRLVSGKRSANNIDYRIQSADMINSPKTARQHADTSYKIDRAENYIPAVSVITPAYNAAGTIARALLSVRNQSYSDWEHIVVDDGSSDKTGTILAAEGSRDPRLVVLTRNNGGASAARNTGLASARGRWLLFLDADDEIASTHIAELVELHELHSEAGAVFSDALKCFPDGTAKQFYTGYLAEYPFEVLADYCATVIHGVLVRRTLVEQVGRFDETLLTCEDWDLWQRIARTGLAFYGTGQPTAIWNVTPKSLSTNILQMTLDGLRVNAQAYQRDPRVITAAPEFEEGLDGDGSDAPVAFLGWCLGQRIALGESIIDGLDIEGSAHDYRGSARAFAASVAYGIFDSVGEKGTLNTYLQVREELASALEQWCTSMDDPQLTSTLAQLIDEEVLIVTGLDCDHHLPFASGVRIDLLRPPNEIVVPIRSQTLIAHCYLGSRLVSKAAIPVFDGKVSILQWRTALAETLKMRQLATIQSFRLLLHPTWRQGVIPSARLFIKRFIGIVRKRLIHKASIRIPLKVALTDAACRLFEGQSTGCTPYGLVLDRVLHSIETVEQPVPSASNKITTLQVEPEIDYDRHDPTEYWESIFTQPDPWSYESDYETDKYRRTLELLDDQTFETGLELACAEGRFTRMLAPLVEHLTAADISHSALERAQERCKDFDQLDFLQLDFFNNEIVGQFDLIVCSEVLYYASGEGNLENIFRKIATALKPGGVFLHAHAFVIYDDLGRTGFDWEGQFGIERISQCARARGDLLCVSSVETELYRIERFQKQPIQVADTSGDPLPQEHAETEGVTPMNIELSDELAGMIVWNGAIATRAQTVQEETIPYVPVLMLHRVADSSSPELQRYTLAPERLDRILLELRRLGYYSLSLDELHRHMRNRSDIPGRPLILSFDDGYQDFADTAWPIVRRNGFSAVSFIVSDRVGQSSDWDRHLGPTYPLMSVDEIQRLASEGCEFGSHLATHRSLDVIDNEACLREALESRIQITNWLGSAPIAVAPPYGQVTQSSARLLQAAGYPLVFTTEHGHTSVFDSGLNLHRIEVTALESYQTIIGKMRAPGTRSRIVRALVLRLL